MEKELLIQNGFTILGPEAVVAQYGPEKAARFVASLLDTVYNGTSDSFDGHPIEKYQHGMENGILFPFFAFDLTAETPDVPIACYLPQWQDSGVWMGSAAVHPAYRQEGSANRFKGKQLYTIAHKWVTSHLGNKVALIYGAPRIPISAAIAINDCDRFPTEWTPYAAWGPLDIPLSSNNPARKQEILAWSELYSQGAGVPKTVYLPTNSEVAVQVKAYWNEAAHYLGVKEPNFVTIEQPAPVNDTFSVEYADGEFTQITPSSENLAGESLSNLTASAFYSNESSRLLMVSLDSNESSSVELQNALLADGYVFTGISPEIGPVMVEDPQGNKTTFYRPARTKYGKLRPGVAKTLITPVVPTLRNTNLQTIAEAICQNWQLQKGGEA